MVVILARIIQQTLHRLHTAVFSLYIVLCYGLGLLSSSASFAVAPANSSLAAAVGQSVELLCRADTSWEWCRCCWFSLTLTGIFSVDNRSR